MDKLVQDIYGGSYEKFGLSGDVVASRYVVHMYMIILTTNSV